MKGLRPGLALALAAALGAMLTAPLWAAPVQSAAAKAAAAKAAAAKAAGVALAPGAPIRGVDAALARGMSDASPAQQVAQALQAMHLTACAAQVEQATNFLFEGQDANFIAQPLGPDSDRWPTVFVIESADPTGAGHNRFATLMITPNCSGMYEQTIYWPQPCSEVKASVFSKFNGDHALLSQVTVADSGPALQVYLTPAGAGCITTKKELFR